MVLTLAEQRAKADVKSATDLAELVRDHGVVLRQEGGNLVGLCPFHEEKTPSFKVQVEGQFYKCFGCGAKGDAISFVRQIKDVGFKEAVATLAARAGIPLPRGGMGGNGAVLAAPQAQKRTGPATPVANKGGAGVHAPSETSATVQPVKSPGCTLAAYAEAKRLPVDFLQGCGLSEIRHHPATKAPAVRIPYNWTDGAERAVQYRIAVEGEDKHRWKSGSKTLLYGLWRLDSTAEYVVLVEGASDCHTLWFHEINALGLPGAANWNEGRDADHLKAYARVYVVVEPDSGGEAVVRWLGTSSIRQRTFLVRLPLKDPSALHCEDPDTFKERWDSAVEAARPWTEIEAVETAERRQATWERCQDLASSPDILGHVAELIEKDGAVGEVRVIKLLYLMLTSRVLDRPVSAAVKGLSSAGKSFLTETVLKAFPPEAFYLLTAMSEHALAYSEEPLRHRFLVLIEAGGSAGDMSNYLMRSLLSEGRLSYETVESTPEGLRARRIEREGPTGLLVTTTRTGLHPENETRLFSLPVTDTKEQTRQILRSLAEDRPSVDFEEARALQAWIGLSDSHVVIPFAEALAETMPPVAVRLRRDFKAVLNLIRAHAILHQATRQRDKDERIVATLGDYSAVRALVADLVAEGVEATVDPTVRQTAEAVTELVREIKDGVTAKAVGDKLQIDKGSAQRRCRKAERLGYLVNQEDTKGKPGRYLPGESMPEDVQILPAPETLIGCAVAPVPEGVDTPPPSAYDDCEERVLV